MRFIFLEHPPHLPSGWYSIYAARISGLAAQTTHKDRAGYFKKYGNWRELKGWLSNLSNEKCWYCEAKNGRAPFDVDHFRPKLGVKVDGIKLPGDTGYYWIAYEWWNFRLSYQRCNRPEGDDDDIVYGKANEFPLHDENARCHGPGSILDDEAPRLLDPCKKGDCYLLAHGLDGEVKPIGEAGTWDFLRAEFTIRQLGLNAFNTPAQKKSEWRLLDDLIRLAGNQPAVVDQLKDYLSESHEYSSFFRSVIGTHRDKPWVEALIE